MIVGNRGSQSHHIRRYKGRPKLHFFISNVCKKPGINYLDLEPGNEF